MFFIVLKIKVCLKFVKMFSFEHFWMCTVLNVFIRFFNFFNFVLRYLGFVLGEKTCNTPNKIKKNQLKLRIQSRMEHIKFIPSINVV